MATPRDAEGSESSEGAGPAVDRRAGRTAWLFRVLLFGLAILIAILVVRVVGKIAWSEVWSSLSLLDWWHPVLLALLLMLRQFLSALPLSFYIVGISAFRATLNDLAAALMTMIAPPPSDVAVRLAMFTSWGIAPAKAVAGVALNTLTFYVIRFSAPLVGFVVAAALGQALGVRWLEVVSVAIAATIVVLVSMVVRSDQLAVSVGLAGGRLARRVRRTVDPQSWAEACRGFRSDIEGRFRRGFPRGLLAQSAMLVTEFTMLVLCLRFVGVEASEVGVAEVAVAFLFAYPLTIFPFSGIGVVDALVLAGLVEVGGQEIEAAAVGGLMIWRVFTVAGPAILGVPALLVWRGTTARRGAR